MTSVTATTAWPSAHSVTDPIKALVDEFFRLASSKEENAGTRFADLFAEDGEIMVPGKRGQSLKGKRG